MAQKYAAAVEAMSAKPELSANVTRNDVSDSEPVPTSNYQSVF
jgi:hypothetical protein